MWRLSFMAIVIMTMLLLNFCDLLNDNGFNIIAAAAFVAQHSIFP